MHSFVFDLGSNFDTGIYGIMLGMSVSNFGPDVQFQGEGLQVEVDTDLDISGYQQKITEKFSVPLVFRLGVQKDVELKGLLGSMHRLSVAMDAINPIDYTVHGGIGAEYSWNKLLFARGGLNWGHDTKGLSLGAGAKWKMIAIDVAYVNYGDLDKTLQFGISLEF
jgi:hypothetical protein